MRCEVLEVRVGVPERFDPAILTADGSPLDESLGDVQYRGWGR